MTLSIKETIQTPAADTAARPRRGSAASDGVAGTIAGLGATASAAVSSTVSFSSEALHALAHAGESAVDGVEDVAVGSWHAIEGAAAGVADVAEAGWAGLKAGVVGLEHAGEAVVGAVETGASEAAAGAAAVGRQIGHYAEVGFHATGDALSEVASGTVMAAAAGGKALVAIL